MGKDKTTSIRWAISELTNQREELESKLKVARKRDETCSLIEEVLAQKEALQTRIVALEEGLQVSTDLVDVPVNDIEKEVSKINDKLEIAHERLASLEQEEYLEELGNKLNRSTKSSGENFTNTSPSDNEFPNTNLGFNSSQTDMSEQLNHESYPDTESAKLPVSSQNSTLDTLMKTKSNRIQPEEIHESAQNVRVAQDEDLECGEFIKKSVVTNTESLEEISARLGIEESFLKEKGVQAILRMIERNGGKLSFPLEVQQIELP